MSEKEVAILSTKLEYMNEKMEQLFNMLKSHIDKEETELGLIVKDIYARIKEVEEKKAGSWTEKAIIRFVSLCMAAIIAGLLKLVIVW